MDYPNITFYDTNDKFAIMLTVTPGTLALDPTLESDIIAYIKTRAASIPGVGTVVGSKTDLTYTSV